MYYVINISLQLGFNLLHNIYSYIIVLCHYFLLKHAWKIPFTCVCIKYVRFKNSYTIILLANDTASNRSKKKECGLQETEEEEEEEKVEGDHHLYSRTVKAVKPVSGHKHVFYLYQFSGPD